MLQLYSQSCSLPVGQPTNVRPNFDDTASKLQRGVGKLSGASNIRIFLICLNVKSYKKREQKVNIQSNALQTCSQLASYADVLKGSSRIPAPQTSAD